MMRNFDIVMETTNQSDKIIIILVVYNINVLILT